MRSILRLAPAAAVACALAAPAGASASPYSDSVLADGPLAYYRLSEPAGAPTAADASPSGAIGTYVGGKADIAGPFTDAGQAAALGGASPSITAILPGAAAAVELWVKPTVNVNGRQQSIVTVGDPGPAGDGFAIGIGAHKKIVLVSHGVQTSSKINLPTRWTMVDVSWDAATKKVTFRASGGAINKTWKLRSDLPAQSNLALTIGGATFSGSTTFQGSVDEIALFDAAHVPSLDDIKGRYATTHLPILVSAPTISGTPDVGQALNVTAGTWNYNGGTLAAGYPSYQWERCNDVDCIDIAGATAPSYTVTADDAGFQIDVEETVATQYGSAFADSDPVTIPGTPGPLDPGDPGAGGGTGGGTGSGGTDTSGGSTTTTSSTTTSTSVTGTASVLGVDVTSGQCGRLTVLPKPKRLRLGKVRATLSLTTRPGGRSPFKFALKAKKGTLRSVSYKLDGKRVRSSRKAPFRATIVTTSLKPGKHTVRVRITPRKGKSRTITLRLQLGGC